MAAPFLLPHELLLIPDFRNILRNFSADRQLAAGRAQLAIDSLQLGPHVPALASFPVKLRTVVCQQVDLALQGVAQQGKLAVRLYAVLQ